MKTTESINKTLVEVIAETEAYIIYLLKYRRENKSVISYYRGMRRALSAVKVALDGDESTLKDMSVTTFRKST